MQNKRIIQKAIKGISASHLARFWNICITNRYLIASLLLLIVMTLHSIYGQWTGDFWEHSAVVKELSTHPLYPQHPLFIVNKAHPFFSPYLLFVGLFSRFASLNPIDALMTAGLLNLLFLLISLRLFIHCFFNKHQDAVAFYALIFFLFLWHPKAWFWSGFIHFNLLAFALPYPSTFAIASTFLIFALYHQALLTINKVKLLLTGVLTLVVILTHPTTAIVTFIGILSISLHHYKSIGFRAIAAGLLILIGAVSLAFLWPYYSFFDLVKSNDLEFHISSYVFYSKFYLILPTLLFLPFALPLLISRFKQNMFDALTLMLCAAVIVYLVGYVTGQYGLGRIISFIAIFIQITLAVRLAQLETKMRVNKSWYALPFIIVLAGIVVLKPAVFGRAFKAFQGLSYSYIDYEIFGRHVGQYDVILSDLLTGWKIPTFGGKIIASPHTTHWIDDQIARRHDLKRFFSNGVKPSEKISIINHYQVDYIFINKNKAENVQPYYNFGDLVYENKNSILIKIHAGKIK